MIESLIRGGVEFAVVAPGSRNTPLVVALSEQEEIPVHSIPDERGAAFFALGRARSRNAPGLVVSTSGTAAAEFHPAVLEASHARVPLIVLTADRPDTLKDTGANQSPKQDELFGSEVRWFRRLPRPGSDRRALRSLSSLAVRATARSVQSPAGPVHLNQPFEKPLVPDPDRPGDPGPVTDPGTSAGPAVETAVSEPEPEAVERFEQMLESSDRSLFLAGPRRPGERFNALLELSESVRGPLLADPLSGLRFGHDSSAIISAYDGILAGDEPDSSFRPDLVIRVGARMTSKPLRRWIASLDARVVQIDPAPGRWEDPEFSADRVFGWPPSALAGIRVGEDQSGSGFLERWKNRQEQFFDRVEEVRPGLEATTEGMILHDLAGRLPAGSGLFVSNSTPVRDLDRFAASRSDELVTAANRGCSGIDGLLSTGLGWAKDSDFPWVLVLGDLALYHDLNGLLTADRCDAPAVVLLLNNDGGGIFELLPIRDHDPPFEPYVRTSHGLTFEGAADMFGWTYREVPPSGAVEAVLDRLGNPEPALIETATDASANRTFRQAITERMNSGG